MSRVLSTDWKMFVREIDVPDSEIDAIVEKYKSEPQEQKYQCLCYWLHDKGNHASFEQLMDAARKSGQVKLVNHIEATLKGVLACHVYYSVSTSCLYIGCSVSVSATYHNAHTGSSEMAEFLRLSNCKH